MTYIAAAICSLLLVTTAEQASTAGPVARAQLGSLADLLVKAQDPVISAVTAMTFAISALMLNYLLYQGRLLPRWLPAWGFLGAVAYFCAGVVAVFTTNPIYLMMPLARQEMVMAVWLIVKGFNTDAPVFHGEPQTDRQALLV